MLRLKLLPRHTGPASAAPSRTPADTPGDTLTGTVFAVRRDWADRTHDFVGPETSLQAAAELWNTEHARWRRSPWRPHLSIMPISSSDFRLHALHRRDCRAPDCPTTGTPA